MKGTVLKQTLLIMLLVLLIILATTGCTGLAVLGYSKDLEVPESDNDYKLKKRDGVYALQKEYDIKGNRKFTPFVGANKDLILLGGKLTW